MPVDSEHSALAQCLRGGARRRGAPAGADRAAAARSAAGRRAELADVTPEQALAHPTWDMGPVVTINSATLVNKGLEVIEAHLLFDIPFDRIDVVVHPQSVVHSMVEFVDGSTLAQASPPDMRLPIALGLGWPDRVPDAAPALRLDHGRAPGTFEPLDDDGVPGGPAGPRGRRARRHRAGGLQRGQRGVRRRRSSPARLPFLGDRRHGRRRPRRAPRCGAPAVDEPCSPWTTSWPPTPGRGRGPRELHRERAA